VQAALGVPQIEREPEHIGLAAGAQLREPRIAESVGRRRGDDVDFDAPFKAGFARRHRQASGGERDVPRRGEGGRRRDGKLDEANAHGLASWQRTAQGGGHALRLARVLLYSLPTEVAMMKIVRENLYPFTVLVCWMVSSAYTLYLLA
jgi:hypothetical protein